MYTWFNYGSYLVWRLPTFSPSIDGRTIFPDSVAGADMLTSGLLRRPEYRTWSSADLAILPLYFGVAATLDSAKQWKRAASLHRPESPADSVGLWVKRSWWVSEGTAPLPEYGLTLTGTSVGVANSACTDRTVVRSAVR
jgi:hypothetical protein